VFISIILSQFVNGWHYYKDYLEATFGQHTQKSFKHRKSLDKYMFLTS